MRNGLARDPHQRLHMVRGWREKGLVYWQARYATCSQNIRKADNSGSIGRALAAREVAEAALIQLGAPPR